MKRDESSYNKTEEYLQRLKSMGNRLEKQCALQSGKGVTSFQLLFDSRLSVDLLCDIYQTERPLHH